MITGVHTMFYTSQPEALRTAVSAQARGRFARIGKDAAMKGLLIVIGSLAAVYTLFGIIQFIGILSQSNPGTAGGGTHIAAGIVPVCVGALVCIVCFQRALRKPPGA